MALDLDFVKREVYAGFGDSDDCVVYIGGPYYLDGAQIHLSKKDVLALAPWLLKAAEYLEQESKRGKR